MYKCKTGEHVWTRRSDAEKCCNGYVQVAIQRAWNDSQQPEVPGTFAGRAWAKIEDLTPRGLGGIDPECPNCDGAGGAMKDRSCGVCWCGGM